MTKSCEVVLMLFLLSAIKCEMRLSPLYGRELLNKKFSEGVRKVDDDTIKGTCDAQVSPDEVGTVRPGTDSLGRGQFRGIVPADSLGNLCGSFHNDF